MYLLNIHQKALVYLANNALSSQGTNLGLGLKAGIFHLQFCGRLNLHRGSDL